jgi:hypothetical protein
MFYAKYHPLPCLAEASRLGHPFSQLTFCASLNEPSCQSAQQESTINTVQNALTFCRSASFDKGEVQLAFCLVMTIKPRVCLSFHALHKRFLCWVKPPTTSLVLGTLADLLREKSELIAENALVRVPLIILHRQIKRPVYRKTDRFLLVLLARMVRTWKQTLFLVQEDDGSREGLVSVSACFGSTNHRRARES